MIMNHTAKTLRLVELDRDECQIVAELDDGQCLRLTIPRRAVSSLARDAVEVALSDRYNMGDRDD